MTILETGMRVINMPAASFDPAMIDATQRISIDFVLSLVLRALFGRKYRNFAPPYLNQCSDPWLCHGPHDFRLSTKYHS